MRLRGSLLAIVGLLYLISIPWYRSSAGPPEIHFGLPDWVGVAVGCYVLAAVANALAWLATDVDDGDPPEPR